MKVLVTGGNGYIGDRLVKALQDSGKYDEIRLITRAGSENSHLATGDTIKVFSYDGTPESIDEAAKDLDAVFHLAAVYKTAWDAETVETLLKSNVIFSAHLLRAVAEHSPMAPVVAASTFSAFDGNHNYAPGSFYDATKMAVEVLAAALPLRITFLRFSDTYGPGDWRKKVHYILRDAVKRGDKTFPFQKPGHQVMNLTHVDDIVAALLHALELRKNTPKGVKTYDLFYDENRITLEELAPLITAGSETVATFNVEGISTPFPHQDGVLPDFVVKHNVRESIREELFKEQA